MLPTLVKNSLSRACLRCYSTSPGPNEELIQVLSRYMEEEKASASSNPFKVRAYSKAISAIGRLPEKVRSVDQVRHLNGVGMRISKRIEAHLSGTPYEPPTPTRSRKAKNADRPLTEHAKTRSRKTLDELRQEQVVSALMSINGIGSTRANTLYDAGCRSLEDIRKPEFLDMLSRSQRVNAQYMIGPNHRVAREQASAVYDFVMQNVSSKFTILLSGDFRRGAPSARHMTFIVLHDEHADVFPPEGSPSIDSTVRQKYTIPCPFASHARTKTKFKGLPDTSTFHTEIISRLQRCGLVVATITEGAQRWDGIIRIPERTKGNEWETQSQRIDGIQTCNGQFFSAEIYYVPRQCAGAASIALTGDTQFNIAIRKAASRLGLRLNEYGLWRWQATDMTTSTDTESQQDGGYWEMITSEKESDILEAVGMEWIPPERRNFGNLDVRSK